MATPSTALPSPASKKAIHNVSTPSAHNLSSPAPRSVPSPATTRKDLSGKTPAAQSTGSKTVGGTPMMLNHSQQGSLPSPMPGIGMTPTGLGVDLGTPGLAATPLLGAGMVPTMSELGLTASGGLRRNEDEERRAKMRKILKTIGRPKGRVSEEGIARISRRVGFANDIDAEKLSNEERERRVGNRTISIAGNTMVIDVELKEHVPQGVQVTFQNDMSNQNGQAERAGRALLHDLNIGQLPQVSTMLDKFSINLERLARLDRLSTKINCFDALSGVYASLKKLYDQELKLASSLKESPEQHVTNIKSGRPALHEDNAVGLSLTYHQQPQHKILAEAQRCPSGIYPPLRVSSAWLSDSFEDDNIPWQEPPHNFPVLDGDVAMTDDGGIPALPDVRFVARFDPPVVLPWQVAASIYQEVGATIPPGYQLSYLSLLLDQPLTSEQLIANTTALRPSGNSYVDVQHTYRLDIAKHDLGYRLEELPFSHPRQIVQILPILRQWLTVKDILVSQLNVSVAPRDTDKSLSLDKLLAKDFAEKNSLIVDCVVMTSPTPMLCLTFLLENGNLVSADIEVLANGVLHLAGGDNIDGADGALAVADISTFAEWLRYRKSS